MADFGFATKFDPNIGLDLFCGSLMFNAPELVKRQIYSEKVDIWALGIITFLLLAGKNPFPGKD